MRELQEAAKAKVELPAHITRLAPNENVFRSGVNTTENDRHDDRENVSTSRQVVAERRPELWLGLRQDD
jgi:hypothetical protein